MCLRMQHRLGRVDSVIAHRAPIFRNSRKHRTILTAQPQWLHAQLGLRAHGLAYLRAECTFGEGAGGLALCSR